MSKKQDKSTQKSSAEASVRLDQWLHAARFFKTRALSAQAIKSGRVLLNNSKVKPAHMIKEGDTLFIKRGDIGQTLDVLGVSKRRASATIAQQLYEETADSVLSRAATSEKRALHAAQAPSPQKRPDKKSRRQLIEFIRGKK